MSLNINKKIKKFKKTVDKLWKRFYNTKELNIISFLFIKSIV